jgi:hypothetical protein
MFNLFKKHPKDELLERQKADLLRSPEEFSKLCLTGVNCDEIPGATGDFGKVPTNPIPVNGPIGEIKYLGRLKLKNGPGIIFHRLGSVTIPQFEYPIDAFEIVSSDGKFWDFLYVDFYHPRRSTQAPKGYVLPKFNKFLGQLGIAYGTLSRDPNFPYTIDKFIEHDYDASRTGVSSTRLAEHYRKYISGTTFTRPQEHEWKFVSVVASLNSTAYYQKNIGR